MTLKLLFVADSPASIASIQPLLKTVNKADYQLLNISPFSRTVFKDGLEFDSIEEYLQSTDSSDFSNETIVVYGTGSGHEREVTLPNKLSNNKCIAIHDLPYIDESQIESRNYKSAYQVIVPNNMVAELIDEHLKKSVSVCLGNPNLDPDNDKYKSPNKGSSKKIVFLSSCGGVEFVNDTDPICQKAILKIIEDNLFGCNEYGLHICLHPRENANFVETLSGNVSFSRGNTTECLHHYNTAISVFSVCILESLLVENKTYKMVPDNYEELSLEQCYLSDYSIVKGSIGKVTQYLEELTSGVLV